MSEFSQNVQDYEKYKVGTWHKICYKINNRRRRQFDSFNYRGDLKTVEDFAIAARHIEQARRISGIKIVDWVKLDIFGRELG